MNLLARLNPFSKVHGEPFVESGRRAGDSPGRWATAVLLILALIPSAFNAIALLPELRLDVPSLNDDAFHYLMIQRASEALANGENPFDHWGPELDLGFPQFFYYQHLPHLAVVCLHRLLLKQVDLFTIFNLVRYLLLIGFPLTVYWSMRRLGFSVVAGAVAAAAATLLSSNNRTGFEYDSYVWRGFGLYTQLWAMHLFFITLDCLHRVLERGTGYAAAVVAFALLLLSHLIYAYIMGLLALVLFANGINRTNASTRTGRLAIVAVLAAVTTAYFWLPFLLFKAYLNASPYLERWKYDSFGARDILTWLMNGDLLDYGRLPVLTVLLALGIASALFARTRPERLALVLFLFSLVLFFGGPTLGRLADLLPMHEGLQFVRFNAGVHMAAILLIGVGGEWVWHRLARLPGHSHTVAAGLLLLVLMAPALRERWEYYAFNPQWMNRTKQALNTDQDARTILAALAELPPGRTYAGLPSNWGRGIQLGDLHFYDLLTLHRIVTTSPQHASFSLNADLTWEFDDRNPAHYNLFNLKYVVAPHGLAMSPFLRRIRETPRYILYQAETSGYAQFASISEFKDISSQSSLLSENRSWLVSPNPGAGRFIHYGYPSGSDGSERSATGGCPGGGAISEERILPGQVELRVECSEASALVLKMTYHPNWRVAIDGRPQRPFMVSPSFIGIDVPAGRHQVRMEYHSPWYKTALLLLGVCTLVATIRFRRRFIQLDARVSSQP